MKILAIADIVVPELAERFDVRRFDGVELILSCGDLPPEYLSRIRDRLDAPLYYVRGNHDIRYRQSPPIGCLNIHRRRVNFKKIRILGLEGARWYNGGPIQYRDYQMRRIIWWLMPGLWFNGGVDIVVTHAPPRHINDRDDRCHRGFDSYVKLIHRFSPSYLLHGHIHDRFADPSQRMMVVGTTRVINTFGYYLLEMDNDRSGSSNQEDVAGQSQQSS